MYIVYRAPIILFILLLASCNEDVSQTGDFVAQVNDRYLLNDHLQYNVPEGLNEELSFALKKNLINSWVENEIFYQSAINDGFSLSEKELFLIESYKKSLLIQKYQNQKLDRNYAITPKDIQDYYREHKKEFIRRTDEINLIHLFMEQKDRAIFAEIKESDELMPIIRKYYFNEKSTMELPNGSLGYVSINRLPESFVKTLRRLKTGNISQEIKTKAGYHFLQLLDWQSAGSQKGVEEVKNEIIRRLQNERRNIELGRLKEDLKEKMQIQTYLSKVK